MSSSTASSIGSRSVFAVVVVAVVVASTGCSPDFSPYWNVDKLRVMTIKADPVVADHMEPVTLSAAAWAPGDAEIEYDWSWCPLRTRAQDNHECPVDDIGDFEPDDHDEAGDNGGEQPPDLLVEDGEEATFFNPFEPQQVRQFCRAIQQEFIEEVDDEQMAELVPGGDCEEGYEISVRLEVATDDDSIVAAKRFKLSAGADEPNENPEFEDYQVRPDDPDDLEELIERVGWDVDEGADRNDQWVSVPADEDFEVPKGIPLEFRTLVDPDSLQTYTPAGDEQPREEGLVYRHFWTGGSITSSRLVYGPDHNTLEDASNSVQTMDVGPDHEDCPEIVDGGCRLRTWTVVRDDRLGVDWMERRFVVRDHEG